MNSFNTDEDTSKILRKYQQKRCTVKTFNQVANVAFSSRLLALTFFR